MTQDQKTILLCALAAWAGYWYAKNGGGGGCGCGAASAAPAEQDPLAWLGSWQQ